MEVPIKMYQLAIKTPEFIIESTYNYLKKEAQSPKHTKAHC